MLQRSTLLMQRDMIQDLQAEQFRELGEGKNTLADGQSRWPDFMTNQVQCISNTWR